jgi:hypothetical protein
VKTGSILLVSGLVIMAIGVAWLIVGILGVGTVPGAVPPATTPQPTPPAGNPGTGPATTLSPSATVTPVTTASETPTAQPTAAVSSDAIKLHFMDLAFGAGNAYLERWDPDDNGGRIVLAMTANSNTDIVLLEQVIREFNSLSQTNQLSENIKEGPSGDIAIKFIPESGMTGIAVNTSESMTSREIRVNDTLAAKFTRGTIYINANLNGDVRNHTLVRSLYYQLGFVGATEDYPDSLFYAGANTNVNLSYIDRKAVEIMYGTGLARGMTVDEVKKAVYIR